MHRKVKLFCFFFSFKKFYAYGCLARPHTCTKEYHEGPVLDEVRRERWIPWDWSPGVWMLGIKPESSGKQRLLLASELLSSPT